MNKKYAQYMTWGKKVESTDSGEQYKLIGEMDESTGSVEAVSLKNYRRWELLRAWLKNGVAERDGKTEEYQNEMNNMVDILNCENIVPIDKVRFITPHYDTLFEVANLEKVSFNDTIKRVVYLDECHFTFEDGAGMYGCFHICQFAELAEQNGWTVKPIYQNQDEISIPEEESDFEIE